MKVGGSVKGCKAGGPVTRFPSGSWEAIVCDDRILAG